MINLEVGVRQREQDGKWQVVTHSDDHPLLSGMVNRLFDTPEAAKQAALEIAQFLAAALTPADERS